MKPCKTKTPQPRGSLYYFLVLSHLMKSLKPILFFWTIKKTLQQTLDGKVFILLSTQVDVLGVDLSTNMLAIANEHKAQMEPEVQARVNFRKLDATSADFGPEKFDVMYSRDAIMHIADKTGLYSKVFVSSQTQIDSSMKHLIKSTDNSIYCNCKLR